VTSGRRWLAIVAVVGGVAACGDDGGAAQPAATKPDPAAAAKKKKDAAAKKKKKKIEVISYIRTLERVVPAEDAPTVRRRLKDRDFAPDPSGNDNRDPFRSYMPGLAVDGPGPTPATTTIGPPTPTRSPVKECKKSQLVATAFSVRDLALIGIVRRGNQRFALVRGADGYGHVVTRNDCLGRERARVTEIAEEIVCYEVPTETDGASVTEALAEKSCVPLYPTTITSQTVIDDDLPDAPPEPAPSTPSPTIAPP
jgi:hypothetical protein